MLLNNRLLLDGAPRSKTVTRSTDISCPLRQDSRLPQQIVVTTASCSERASKASHVCWAAPAREAHTGAAPRDIAAPGRRQLIMMRHAESEETAARDHDREITEAGRASAQQVARQLQEAGWQPDLIMCSNSVRTRQTLEEMMRSNAQLQRAIVHYRGDLYTIAALDGQTRSHLQAVILEETAEVSPKCVLCLGHNRGWEEAASSFTAKEVKLEPCTAALLESDAQTWEVAFASSQPWGLVSTLQADLSVV